MFTRLVLAFLATSAAGCAESARPAADNATPVAQHPSATEPYRGPGDVLRQGRFTVDIMRPAAPPRFSELAERIQQAAEADPEWWLSHVQKAEPGQPLPYDRRIGLSKSEWEEWLELGDRMSVTKTGEAVLRVTKKDESVYVLDAGRSLPDLTGIEIDLANDMVRTPFGVAKGKSEVAIEKSAMGAWNGTEWQREEVASSGRRGTIVSFSVGKLKPSGRGVIYYDVRQTISTGKTRIRQILFFDLSTN